VAVCACACVCVRARARACVCKARVQARPEGQKERSDQQVSLTRPTALRGAVGPSVGDVMAILTPSSHGTGSGRDARRNGRAQRVAEILRHHSSQETHLTHPHASVYSANGTLVCHFRARKQRTEKEAERKHASGEREREGNGVQQGGRGQHTGCVCPREVAHGGVVVRQSELAWCIFRRHRAEAKRRGAGSDQEIQPKRCFWLHGRRRLRSAGKAAEDFLMAEQLPFQGGSGRWRRASSEALSRARSQLLPHAFFGSRTGVVHGLESRHCSSPPALPPCVHRVCGLAPFETRRPTEEGAVPELEGAGSGLVSRLGRRARVAPSSAVVEAPVGFRVRALVRETGVDLGVGACAGNDCCEARGSGRALEAAHPPLGCDYCGRRSIRPCGLGWASWIVHTGLPLLRRERGNGRQGLIAVRAFSAVTARRRR
jgi:hypothetical protein